MFTQNELYRKNGVANAVGNFELFRDNSSGIPSRNLEHNLHDRKGTEEECTNKP